MVSTALHQADAGDHIRSAALPSCHYVLVRSQTVEKCCPLTYKFIYLYQILLLEYYMYMDSLNYLWHCSINSVPCSWLEMVYQQKGWVQHCFHWPPLHQLVAQQASFILKNKTVTVKHPWPLTYSTLYNDLTKG